MKVFVHYDRSGAIHGLIAVNAAADRMPMLVPDPGLFVAEVEGKVRGWKHEAEQPDLEALRTIAQTLRVDTPIPRCKLVRK